MNLRRVVIRTESPRPGRIPNPNNTEVWVDDVQWTDVLGYRVEQGVNEPQTITLTILADVTIEHLP